MANVLFTIDETNNTVLFQVSSGGGGSSTFSGLTDTDISSPANGETPIYNSTSGKWENGTVSGSGDMLKAVYDPTNINSSAFSMDNMVEGTTTKILTSTERTAITTNTAKVSYTDAAKVAGIEAGATADQSDAEIETAYNNQVDVVSQVEAETGTATTVRRWTAERVKQAIAALAGGGSSVWGAITGTLSNQTDLQNALNAKAASSHSHTASDVTDFDTEVSNNASVTANTAKVSYTDAVKMAGIESGATADQTDIEIKTAYENNANTNAFTDAEKTNLGNQSGTNTGDNAVNTLYSGLVTNATHTGEVTGSGALTLDSTAITNKTLVTAASTDHVIIADASDGGNLKKALVSDLTGSGGTDADAIHDNVGGEIAAITAKATPTTSDILLIEDAAASNAKKRITIGDLPSSGGGASEINELSDGSSDGSSVFLGTSAGVNDDGANLNTGVGVNSLSANTSGGNNTAIGHTSLNGVTSGYINSAIGKSSLGTLNTGFANSSIGYESGLWQKGGSYNTAIGTYALKGTPVNVTTTNNTAIGANSLVSIKTNGDNNTAIGYGAGANVTTGANNIIVGYNIHTQSATAGNEGSIGNVIFMNGGAFGTGTSVGTNDVGIGVVPSTGAKLEVNGNTEITGTCTITNTIWLDSGQTVGIFTGNGTPEATVTGAIGSTYHRTDGGASTSFYVKESGTGNTGWVAK